MPLVYCSLNVIKLLIELDCVCLHCIAQRNIIYMSVNTNVNVKLCQNCTHGDLYLYIILYFKFERLLSIFHIDEKTLKVYIEQLV